MKTISRTIESIKIQAEKVYYNENNEFIHEELKAVVTTDKEEKVRKNLGKYFSVEDTQTLVIKSIEKTEKVYEVPVDEFIMLAEKLESEKLIEAAKGFNKEIVDGKESK